MAGLGPAIHVLVQPQDVDARDKPAHDSGEPEAGVAAAACQEGIQDLIDGLKKAQRHAEFGTSHSKSGYDEVVRFRYLCPSTQAAAGSGNAAPGLLHLA